MNKSSSSVSGKTKFKIVFLGDTNTGKTSIIDRFINDKFNPESTVNLFKMYSLPSGSILLVAMSTIRINTIDYSYGIQPDNNAIKVLYLAI
jgi:GTPase SAR1 family protein